MNSNPFIFTSDEFTANLLSKHGFQLVSHNSSGYTFLNCKKDFNFDNLPKGKYSYTKILCI